MVEVTQEDLIAGARIAVLQELRELILAGRCDDGEQVQIARDIRIAAFNAGRASVLEELESPTEAMLKAGIGSDIWNGQPVIRRTVTEVFTAMIGAYKEAL